MSDVAWIAVCGIPGALAALWFLIAARMSYRSYEKSDNLLLAFFATIAALPPFSILVCALLAAVVVGAVTIVAFCIIFAPIAMAARWAVGLPVIPDDWFDE